MKVQTVNYADGRWSHALPKDMDSEQTLVLVFGNPLNAVNEVIKAFPKAQIIGCSTAGEIHDSNQFLNTLNVTVCRLERTRMKVARIPYKDYDQSFQAGEQLYQSLNGEGFCGALVFGNGFMNGDQFSRGINKANQKKLVIAGGLAGDPMIKDTWVIDRDGIHRDAVVGLGFYGAGVELMVSSHAGVTPIGVERTVTKSVRNTLYEVDGKPALSFYEEFLGEKIHRIDQLAIQYPIAVSKDYRIKDDELIRTPFGINQQEKSITYTGEVPEGSKIRLMMAATDNLIDGSEKAAKQLYQRHVKGDNTEYLLIPVSCLTRKLVMGEFVDDEIESIRDQFKSQKDVVNGFYSFGEIATDASGVCSLHNQTMNLIMLYEK